ncbi:fumarylacetoacetate (FAA) hydrolase [Emticicia oligotrophica DSM 17448]|jgi:2-keto-4-pentenoate hydratase/2-oxohepta-3-ene-1,7-dioic acid hydratase in catechol pathway|uniref:Fumarylacetoacetate (FAA) hydrolase n=1 Tax=Emticicia oligotrophica (strain DSM 17448 / CIP 109782 / MTCC 6937 / GPTSA100-15) TaxID=929562 RepID=A0ABM5N0C5_EMTOG|nr:fumarylacetoacetate hydrolase family protein [Emticicia oligotrophica]AFK02792.1 fumarylacetoacetate (FAA) hydrolase [Emticicia oligotrophica DSM 17448]
MKLFRFGDQTNEKPGVILANDKKIDVSTFGEDYNEQFFATDGINRLENWLRTNAANCPTVADDVRLASCVARPSKIICIGLNYAKHAAESNMALPTEPVVFFKATTALCGPNDDVVIPKNSVKTDWEVELAFVIGKKASYVEKEDAMSYIAGYCLHNDYSEREFQLERGGQWVKGKSCDTFAPLGPFMATADEISNPHDLRLWLSLNGEMLQDSNTDDMIFDIPTILSYLSQFMTLLPGDVISTGTPAGVGLGLKPQRYLVAGDVVELGIDNLGTQKQTAVAYHA